MTALTNHTKKEYDKAFLVAAHGSMGIGEAYREGEKFSYAAANVHEMRPK